MRSLPMCCALAVALLGAAPAEKVIYEFSGPDGLYPLPAVVFDGAGNLFGVTQKGGAGSPGYGTAYELSPARGGTWTQRLLHSFGIGHDATFPSAPLIVDGLGNLYGTAPDSGPHNSGIVFELSPVAGSWTYQVIHAFRGPDGFLPDSGVIMDPKGNLYGTTVGGGIGGSGGGVVFQLTLGADHRWHETKLHDFIGSTATVPEGGLVLDGSGNLYGTTQYGGVPSTCGGGLGCGTVFETVPASRKTRLLYTFRGSPQGDAQQPTIGLVFDHSGNLWGTTASGGVKNNGTIYELTPTRHGSWKERVVYSFVGGPDGAMPTDKLLFDAAGNMYGTASAGGDMVDCPLGGCGVVFKLSHAAGGAWKYADLHTFTGHADGAGPLGALVFDRAGNLYGTTAFGGAANAGVVYEITL
jgi:uncharacterized repeat protein (TIGR03803 family)